MKSLWLVIFSTLISECLSFAERGTYEDVELIDFANYSSISLPKEAYHPKIKSMLIKTKVRFRYARTRIISTIMNPDPRKSHEVNFSLRIPKEAFITKFEMRINGGLEIYKANVTRRENATRQFEFAKSEGRSVTAGLLESKINFDELSMKFIIGAQTTILFSLIYEERLPRILDNYEFIIHLIPEQLSNKTIFRIEVLIEETLKIASIDVPMSFNDNLNFKNATIEKTSDTKATVKWNNYNFDNGQSKWDYPMKEFVVSYSLDNEASTGQVLVRNGYLVHFFVPTDLEPLKKHVIFVLDISDSMTGTKMKQTQSAMIEILDELKFDDFFNIITFSSDVTVWSCFHGIQSQTLYPFPVNAECKDEAISFITRKLIPHGSTNINNALLTALEMAKNVSSIHSPLPTKTYKYSRYTKFQKRLEERLPQDVQSIILFFTDGEATSGVIDKKAILITVKNMNYDLEVPIFSLGFGESADFEFLMTLSIRNRGFARKIYEHADSDLQLADFYREISSPVLSNLTFTYTIGSNDRLINVTNSGYSMIFKGTENIVVGKLQQANENLSISSLNITVAGTGRKGKVSYPIPIKDCQIQGSCSDELDIDDKCVEKLFVYLTIKKLLDEEYICDSDRFYYQDDNTELYDNCVFLRREQAIQLAILHGFVTPYTSMVMRTKSILEEEMEEDTTANQNDEWEWFLRNENPLPDHSKLTDGRIHLIKDNFLDHEILPRPDALASEILEFQQIKNTAKYYKVVNLPKNRKDFKESSLNRNISILHEKSRNFNESVPNQNNTLSLLLPLLIEGVNNSFDELSYPVYRSEVDVVVDNA